MVGRNWLLVALLGVGLHIASIAALGEPEFKAGTELVVQGASAGDKLNLRSEPAAASKSLAELPPDATGIVATGRTRMNGPDKWIEVRVGGQVGWVHSRYVRAAAAKAKPVQAGDPDKGAEGREREGTDAGYSPPKEGSRLRVHGVAIGDKLNMREFANAKATVVFELLPDATGLIATGRAKGKGTDTWLEVRHAGKRGWVHSHFVRELQPNKDVETATPDRAPSGNAREPGKSADPLADCNSNDGSLKLSGCTALIEKAALGEVALALAYSRRSDSYIQANKFDKAITDRHEALKLAPEGPYYKARLAAAYHLRGLKHTTAHDYEVALADYAQALKYDGKNDRALEARALTYAQMGDLNKAIDDLLKARDLDSTQKRYRDELVNMYERRAAQRLARSEYANAIGDCDAALNLGEETAEIYVLRANVYFADSNPTAAREDIEKAVSLDPGNMQALRLRGELRLDYNKLLAAADFSEVLKKDPKNIPVLLLRAAAYDQSEHFDEALADYRAVLKIDPKNSMSKRSIKRIREFQKSRKRAG